MQALQTILNAWARWQLSRRIAHQQRRVNRMATEAAEICYCESGFQCANCLSYWVESSKLNEMKHAARTRE